MIAQESWITELLDKNGWQTAEKRRVEYLWITEIWKVKTEWSPADCSFYLVFEVDGQDHSQDFENVKWLKAYRSPPTDWSRDRSEIGDFEDMITSCPLGRGQEKHINAFFEDLAMFRNNYGS